jgi:hypothetical protein
MFEDVQPPALEDGEWSIRSGIGALVRGSFGTRTGPLTLTNRRLIWTSTKRTQLPFRKNAVEVRLADIESVDKGTPFNFIFGGMCIRLRLKNGRTQTLYEADGELDEWITAIRAALLETPGNQRAREES